MIENINLFIVVSFKCYYCVVILIFVDAKIRQNNHNNQGITLNSNGETPIWFFFFADDLLII